MSKQVKIVLVHGAGTGPWIWEELQKSLPVPSILPEVGSRTTDANPSSCAENIIKQIDDAGAERVVLVLHSLAGVLASALQKRLGNRIASIVFLSAVVPTYGNSFLDTIGFPSSLALKILFKLNPRGLKPSEKMIRAELCNDLSDSYALKLIERYEAEWPGLYLARMEDSLDFPHSVYIYLKRDLCVPPKLQKRVIANLQKTTVVELEAGHMVMLSSPDALGEIIMDVSKST